MIKKRLASRLPIVGDVTERLYNPNSCDLYNLSLPNTALALAAIGKEQILLQEPDMIICSSNSYIRYLVLTPQNDGKQRLKRSQFHQNKEFSVASLAIKRNNNYEHIVDHIYVDEAYRRQGVGSWLIERAYKDFPDLCLDGRFTNMGILFFGAKHRKK